MKRSYESILDLNEFSKKLKLNYTFDINDCYTSIDTIVLGMPSNKFIKDTYFRYINYLEIFTDIDIELELKTFFTSYVNQAEQIELVKIIYKVDSKLIENHSCN